MCSKPWGFFFFRTATKLFMIMTPKMMTRFLSAMVIWLSTASRLTTVGCAALFIEVANTECFLPIMWPQCDCKRKKKIIGLPTLSILLLLYIYYLEILPAFYARISSFLIYDYLLPRKMWIKRRQTAWIIINSMQLQSPPSHPLRIISTLIIETSIITIFVKLMSWCLLNDLLCRVKRIRFGNIFFNKKITNIPGD